MNLSISKLFLAVAKGAILNRPTNIDKSAIQEWEEKISDTEKKIKLSDLPIYFFNGTTCSFDKNPYGDYLYFIKRDCFTPTTIGACENGEYDGLWFAEKDEHGNVTREYGHMKYWQG